MTETKPTITVSLRVIYGKERFYPANETSEVVCKILGTKSLTKEQLLICKEAGWTVNIQLQEYKLE